MHATKCARESTPLHAPTPRTDGVVRTVQLTAFTTYRNTADTAFYVTFCAIEARSRAPLSPASTASPPLTRVRFTRGHCCCFHSLVGGAVEGAGGVPQTCERRRWQRQQPAGASSGHTQRTDAGSVQWMRVEQTAAVCRRWALQGLPVWACVQSAPRQAILAAVQRGPLGRRQSAGVTSGQCSFSRPASCRPSAAARRAPRRVHGRCSVGQQRLESHRADLIYDLEPLRRAVLADELKGAFA